MIFLPTPNPSKEGNLRFQYKFLTFLTFFLPIDGNVLVNGNNLPSWESSSRLYVGRIKGWVI